MRARKWLALVLATAMTAGCLVSAWFAALSWPEQHKYAIVMLILTFTFCLLAAKLWSIGITLMRKKVNA
jgi:hypothetical protein